MLLAMADVRVVLIVLAARLHHLRGLTKRRPAGSPRSALADETLRVFAPLANRLGVWSLKAEMEDLCFQVRRDVCSTCQALYATYLMAYKARRPRSLAQLQPRGTSGCSSSDIALLCPHLAGTLHWCCEGIEVCLDVLDYRGSAKLKPQLHKLAVSPRL